MYDLLYYVVNFNIEAETKWPPFRRQDFQMHSINISLKFVPKDQIDSIPALVRIMAWRWPGDRPLSESMMFSLLTIISITGPQWVKSWPQWVKSLRPGDAICWHITGLTLAQVMACCLAAPSHYLNQCWFVIIEINHYSPVSLLIKSPQSGVTLCFQFVSAAAAAMTFASHVKTDWANPYIFGTKKV